VVSRQFGFRKKAFPCFLLLLALLSLGIFFRIVNLGSKVFWVDEVATAIRVAGYTKEQVIQEISQRGVLTVTDLLAYQHPTSDQRLLHYEMNWNVKPKVSHSNSSPKLTPPTSDRSFADTLNALLQSPEHAPLYFVLTRLWTQVWGSSVTALRSLSVVASLLTLPCLYWLCWLLFRSSTVGAIATSLMAISPFFVAYAQEARPYSLWTLTILLSSITLIYAVRSPRWRNWGGYAIALLASLYTSLLSLIVALGQSIYILLVTHQQPKIFMRYSVMIVVVLFLFSPWMIIVLLNWLRVQNNTTWMQAPMGILPMLAIWLYSIVIIFVDFPVYLAFDLVIVSAVLADLGLLTLVGYAFYFLMIKAPKPSVWFVLTLTIFTPLVLIAIDLLFHRQASTAPRYMIPAYLGIQLAVAYLLANKLSVTTAINQNQRRFWQVMMIVLLTFGIASGIANLERSPRYQKTRNLHNQAIATLINQAPTPMLWIESESVLDALSISHQLRPDVRIQWFSEDNVAALLNQCSPQLLFNPTDKLLKLLQTQKKIQIEAIYQPKLLIPDEIFISLWIVKSLETDHDHFQSRC
jgi:uncharacterized membrane protein